MGWRMGGGKEEGVREKEEREKGYMMMGVGSDMPMHFPYRSLLSHSPSPAPASQHLSQVFRLGTCPPFTLKHNQ